MKKKILIVFSIFLLVSSVFFSIHTYKKQKHFLIYKGEIIEEYQKQLPFIDAKKQKELKSFIVDLENINNQKDLFIMLDSQIDGQEENNFENTKQQILVSLQTEIEKKTDKHMQKKLAGQIKLLKSASNSEIFFQELQKVYKSLNTFYDENTIVFVSEEDMKNYDFFSEKEKILEILNKEIQNITDEATRKIFENQMKELQVSTDTVFFEQLDAIYKQIDVFYKKQGIEIPKLVEREITDFQVK